MTLPSGECAPLPAAECGSAPCAGNGTGSALLRRIGAGLGQGPRRRRGALGSFCSEAPDLLLLWRIVFFGVALRCFALQVFVVASLFVCALDSSAADAEEHALRNDTSRSDWSGGR